MTAPLFSVVIPTYNRPNLLARAIDSVLVQSISDFEVIIVDDGSDCDYARRLVGQACCSKLRLLTNSGNRGVGATRNRGIEAARGRYVSFLDDDDEFLPDFLALSEKALEATPETIGASWSQEALGTAPSGDYEGTEMAGFLMAGAGCGLTFKADCLRCLGGFNEDFPIGEDTELIVRFLSHDFRPVPLFRNAIRVNHDAERRLSASARREERQRVLEWIRITYAGFLRAHPHLRALLSPDSLSGRQPGILDMTERPA
jgi:glycosyltransferase involved in cell wall biosynthesis